MSPPATPSNSALYNFAMRIPWFLVCLFTIGFPVKYRERLHLFEDPCEEVTKSSYERWKGKAAYSDRGGVNDPQKSMRQKQQEEWDRLNIAMSVITATSTAALAIQATNSNTQIYQIVTSFYSIAFGLSLEGLILITYRTISAGGSPDEAVTLIARSEFVSSSSQFVKNVMIKLTAFTMALPAILATYSLISLLVSLVAMAVARPGEGADIRDIEYILVIIIPVGVGFLFVFSAFVLCEIGNWTEIWGRRNAKAQETNNTGPVAHETGIGVRDTSGPTPQSSNANIQVRTAGSENSV